MGLIENFNAQRHATANDMRHDFSKILTDLHADSRDFRPVDKLLCRVCQEKFTKVSCAVDAVQRREEIWVQDFDALNELSLGIIFYEGSPTVPQNYVKAARFLYAALYAGKWEAN